MNKLKLMLPLCLAIFSCTDEVPPTVDIIFSYHTSSGVITISVITDDDIAIDRVGLFIDSEIIEYSYGDYTSHSFVINTNDYENGTHTIYAIAYDSSENSTNSEIYDIDFLNHIELTINNTTYGDISIEVLNQNKIIESGGTAIFEIEKNYGNLTYSGQLSNVDCGLNLIWGLDSYIDIQDENVTRNLVVGPERFFLEISNNLSVDVSHFKVYENSIDTTNYVTCNESTPNNGIIYGRGFYEVRNDLLFRFYLLNNPDTPSIHTTTPPIFDNQNNQKVFYNLFGFLSSNEGYNPELGMYKNENNLYPSN